MIRIERNREKGRRDLQKTNIKPKTKLSKMVKFFEGLVPACVEAEVKNEGLGF